LRKGRCNGRSIPLLGADCLSGWFQETAGCNLYTHWRSGATALAQDRFRLPGRRREHRDWLDRKPVRTRIGVTRYSPACGAHTGRTTMPTGIAACVLVGSWTGWVSSSGSTRTGLRTPSRWWTPPTGSAGTSAFVYRCMPRSVCEHAPRRRLWAIEGARRDRIGSDSATTQVFPVVVLRAGRSG
jgi:hypothetical protein